MPSAREAEYVSTVRIFRSGNSSASWFAAILLDAYEPLMPEDMLTNRTSSPFSSIGRMLSTKRCGGICEVVTFSPFRIAV